MFLSVNYLAVLLCAVAAMAIGYVWYHPSVFGNYWTKLTGRNMDAMSKGGFPPMLIMVFAVLVMSWVLAEILKFSGATTLLSGFKIAFLVWFGFILTTGLANSVFAGKSKELIALEQAHHLVVILVLSAILILLP